MEEELGILQVMIADLGVSPRRSEIISHYLLAVHKPIADRDAANSDVCREVLTDSLSQDDAPFTEITTDVESTFELGQLIVNTGDAMLYTSRETDSKGAYPFVIKYQFRAWPVHADHPLVAEFEISVLAASESIGPAPLYLSPEYQSPQNNSDKCRHVFCGDSSREHGVHRRMSGTLDPAQSHSSA